MSILVVSLNTKNLSSNSFTRCSKFLDRLAVHAIFAFTIEAPASVLTVQGCPNPEERPDNVQSYKANPTGDMQRVLMWVIAIFRNFIRDIVDDNNQVEKSDTGKTSMPKAR